MMNTEFFGIAPGYLAGLSFRPRKQATGAAARPAPADPVATAVLAERRKLSAEHRARMEAETKAEVDRAVLAERRRLSEQHRAKMEGRQA